MFTDSSKIDAGTGADVCVLKGNIRKSYGVPCESRVFQDEILGIIMTTELINDNVFKSNCRAVIYVDSQAVLKVIAVTEPAQIR